MKAVVLGSGSGGNATYVEAGGVRLLIDAGFACRTLEQRLAAVGASPDGLDGILVTHEHTDHMKGLANFVKRHPTAVFVTEGTAAVCEHLMRRAKETVPDFAVFQPRVPFALGDLTITPIPISHDVAEPVGYTLADGAEKLGYFTDLGIVTAEILAAFAGCTDLILESNHDPETLRRSGRPWSLITRISGESGHLSNEQACQAVAAACPPELRSVTLAHLSEECNAPELACRLMAATLQHIGRGDVTLRCAAQNASCPVCGCC